MKQTARIAFLLTTGTLLRLSVALFIMLATVFSLYTQRSYILKVFEETNSYERLPYVILNSSAKQQLGQDEETQLGSSSFAPIVLEAAPPEVAQFAAQEIVNGYYNWLEGDAQSVSFRIDLSSSKTVIIDGIVAYALNRYNNLEECTEPLSGFDFFSIPCKLPGLPIDTQEEALRTQLENTPLLLRNTLYDQDNLLTDATGRSLDEFAPWLRNIYSNRMIITLFSGLMVVVLVVLNIVGASSFIKGMRRIGKILFQGSSGFLITALFILLILPMFGFAGSNAPATGQPLEWSTQTYDALFNDIINRIARDFVTRGLLYSIPLAMIGAGAWIFGSYQREKEKHTGVISYVTKPIKATLKNSGLVSSEKQTHHPNTKKSNKSYPIVSSDDWNSRHLRKKNYETIKNKIQKISKPK